MRRFVLVLVLATLSAGCASVGGAQDWRPWRSRAEAGHIFVRRACAGCHAVGVRGLSPNPLSPPFRTLAERLPGAALKADLSAIASRGHAQMPPIYMTPGEIRAVAAYIRSVAPRSVT
ncbi:cytochrome c [Phenylobacterium sp. LjRoot225]|uniref:c-type cytochrome n=1 Tax=Phenylobacterium sp. LjRoot225 TaxID=3342285 RepID=UPI003ECDBC06